MKLKNINNNKFKLKVNHKELVVIENALKKYNISNVEEVNNLLFDKDEFKNINKFNKFKKKILEKINEKLKKIFPY